MYPTSIYKYRTNTTISVFCLSITRSSFLNSKKTGYYPYYI